MKGETLRGQEFFEDITVSARTFRSAGLKSV